MKKFMFIILSLGVCLAICRTDSWGMEVKGNNPNWTLIGSVKQGSVIKINASGIVDFGCRLGACRDSATAGVTGSSWSNVSIPFKEAMHLIFSANPQGLPQSMTLSPTIETANKSYNTIFKYFGITCKPSYDQGGVWIKVVRKNGTPYIGTQLYYFWANDINNMGGLPLIEDVNVYAKAHDGGRSPDATSSYGDNIGSYTVSILSKVLSGAQPAVQQPSAEDCVSFNPATTTVNQIQNSWKIVDGNHWMFDFGTNKAGADRALAVIKFYNMNNSCFVGRPQPSFSYLLSGTNAPAGTMSGEDCIRFNPVNAQVQQVSGRWKIVDGSMWMYDFGSSKAQADQAMAIIKKYGFAYQCFVARPNPQFQYLHK